MRERQLAVRPRQDRGGDRLGDSFSRHDVARHPAERRRAQQLRPRRRRERVEPRRDEPVQRLRNRQRLVERKRALVRERRATELERIERIPTRDALDLRQQRPLEVRLQLPAKERRQRVPLERRHRDPLRARPARPRPRRQQHPHPPLQPPPRELEHRPRRLVQPLQIVDRNKQRPPLVEPQQQRLDRDPERAEVGRLGGRLVQEERDAQRPPLRRRQLAHLVPELTEQIAERSEGQLRLRLGRPRRYHPQPAPARKLDSGTPQRRLADPGVALEEQRPRRIHAHGALDCGQLRVATNDPVHVACPRCHMRAAVERRLTSLTFDAAPRPASAVETVIAGLRQD